MNNPIDKILIALIAIILKMWSWLRAWVKRKPFMFGAMVVFLLSFIIPRYFIQVLVLAMALFVTQLIKGVKL